MTVPAKYTWLYNLELPRTIAEGLKLYGVTEKPGKADSPTIMGWVTETKIAGYYADAVPWCGLYAAVVALRAGKPIPEGPLWALNWKKFGVAVFEDASLGDVLVFKRPGGGHVGFYIAEDATHYHVLGGNQGDAVSIIRIAKSRCVAVRRPAYKNKPAAVRPYKMAASGAVSTDEA